VRVSGALRRGQRAVHNRGMPSHFVTIIIPAFNQAEITAQCIASIRAHTRVPYRVLLVDNGSNPPLAPAYEAMEHVTVIRSEQNLGFAAGVNLGLTQAEGHVVLLNNDTLVPEAWLEGMLSVLDHDSNVGAVGPMSNCVSGSQLIPDLQLESMEAINEYASHRRAELAVQPRTVARLVGFCMMLRDRVVRDVGLLDELFATGNFEDDDYCVRILRAGYQLCVDEGSFVFHYGSQTFQAMGLVGEAWHSLIAANDARFQAKWNLRPEDRLDSFQVSLEHNRRGAACFAAGDKVGALRALVEAIQVEPHLSRNHNDLAVVLWQHGEKEKAYARVKQALQLEPASRDARSNLEEMAAALGESADAQAFLRGLENEDPS